MATVVEVNSRVELIVHLTKLLEPHNEMPPLAFNDIRIEPYGGFDERIGWNTHIVYLPGYGVLGFTDGPL